MDGVHSSTGYAEGCGLSCTAAVILGVSFHRFAALRAPGLQASSYVDNLTGVSSNCQDIIHGSRVFSEWAGAWDLTLDKTLAWSTWSRDRETLRQAGFQIVLDGPDLGGHMQYALRRTNFSLVARISDYEEAWARLGHSSASYARKVSAVRVAGLPAALHAASLVHVGARHFHMLRSQAVKALGEAGPGLNPCLLLGFAECPLADPEYFALWGAVRDCVRFADKSVAVACLDAAAVCSGNPVPGPFGVLLTRLQRVGVHWDPPQQIFLD